MSSLLLEIYKKLVIRLVKILVEEQRRREIITLSPNWSSSTITSAFLISFLSHWIIISTTCIFSVDSLSQLINLIEQLIYYPFDRPDDDDAEEPE